jgi:hypothetical protein
MMGIERTDFFVFGVPNFTSAHGAANVNITPINIVPLQTGATKLAAVSTTP